MVLFYPVYFKETGLNSGAVTEGIFDGRGCRVASLSAIIREDITGQEDLFFTRERSVF